MTRWAKGRAPWSAALAVSLAASLGVAGPGAAADVPQCRTFDLSPEFGTDGTAFCADSGATRLVVFRTTDRGRTWARVGADSPWLPDQSRVTQVVVSADYARDRTVYLATTSTVYVSQDAGETFVPADLLSSDSSGRRVFTTYRDGATGLAYLVFGKYQSPARIRPPAHEPVAAALPSNTDRFLLPRTVTAESDPLLLAFTGRGEDLRSTVYGCSVRLDCLDARGSFQYTALAAWRSPRYAADRTLYFATRQNGLTFLRSTDGGRTITPFTPLNKAFAALNATVLRTGSWGGWPAMAVGPNGRIYVRLEPRIIKVGAPAQVLLRSDDNGKTWKQVAVQYMGSRRGNLPFEPAPHTTRENATQLMAAPDGRLFAMGDGFGENDTGPWCSLDGGVRWHRVCPR